MLRGFTHPTLRPRVVADVGIAYRINEGPGLPPGHPMLPIIEAAGSPYRWYEGDLFTPLTGNYVFDPPWELPTSSYFGGGGCVGGWWRQPNVFTPRQAAPQSGPFLNTGFATNVPATGLNGLIAGQFSTEPLLDDGGRYAEGGY